MRTPNEPTDDFRIPSPAAKPVPAPAPAPKAQSEFEKDDWLPDGVRRKPVKPAPAPEEFVRINIRIKSIASSPAASEELIREAIRRALNSPAAPFSGA